jgi:hypothetical protein
MQRITQIQINENWKTIPFADIEHGDKFRLFDEGEPVVADGKTSWVAIGEPYKDDDGILTINAF